MLYVGIKATIEENKIEKSKTQDSSSSPSEAISNGNNIHTDQSEGVDIPRPKSKCSDLPPIAKNPEGQNVYLMFGSCSKYFYLFVESESHTYTKSHTCMKFSCTNIFLFYIVFHERSENIEITK